MNEFWVTREREIPRKRYHYQYAVFSASGYSKGAERIAFAHDVYLMPLAGSVFFAPILRSIRSFGAGDFGGVRRGRLPSDLKALRRVVRNLLAGGVVSLPSSRAREKLDLFIERCRRLGFALLCVVGNRFPIFLVPNEGVNIEDLMSRTRVKIRGSGTHWYLTTQQDKPLFSFEWPEELILLYAKEKGKLDAQSSLRLKEEMMQEFQAIFFSGDQFRLIRFQIDQDWLAEVRLRVRPESRKRRPDAE